MTSTILKNYYRRSLNDQNDKLVASVVSKNNFSFKSDKNYNRMKIK